MSEDSVSLSLNRATTLGKSEGGVLQVHTCAPFWTLIGPFGGWSAAVALRAVLESSESGFVPVSINAHFAGAVDEGVVDVHPECVRRNRGTEFWSSRLFQNGDCAIDTQIVLASRRMTEVMYESAMPDAVPADGLATTEFPGVPWTTTYDCRFVTPPPGSDTGSVRSLFWVRLRCDEPVRFHGLVSLCDACVPRPFFVTDTFFPVSTISMGVQLFAEPDDLVPLQNQFLLVEATGTQAERGFFGQQLRVWAPGGKLLATSDQLFWYKK